MPKLRSRDEHEHFERRGRRNLLAQEILADDDKRGFVRKRADRTLEEDRIAQRRLARAEFRGPVAKPLRVHIYSRNGVIYFRYSYPFAQSMCIEKSTGVRASQGAGFPKRAIRVPEELTEFFVTYWNRWSADELIQYIRGAWEGSRWNEFEFLTQVDDPKRLIGVLANVQDRHGKRLSKDIFAAIESGEGQVTIEKMKAHLLKYNPERWFA